MRPDLLVTGVHRCGTTFLGRVLFQTGRFAYIHEPLNAEHGLRGVDTYYWYTSNRRRGAAHGLVDSLFDGSFRYRKQKGIMPSRKIILAGIQKHVLRGKAPTLIKDPFCSLASKYMKDRHGVRVAIIVRHPVAFYLSIRRMGWDFGFDHLTRQPDLMEEHLSRHADLLSHPPDDLPGRTALLWSCIYTVLNDFANDGDGAWLMLRHEDFCADPEQATRQVLAHAGLSPDLIPRRYLARKMQGGDTVPQDDRLHQWSRDAAQLAWHWRNSVDRGVVDRMRAVSGEIGERFYSAEEW